VLLGRLRDVRLVNGNSPCEGRVEVFHQGQWGTVCDDYWDMKDAAVVCRQMFCGDAVAALGNGHFGEGEGQIWMDLGCSGSASTLKEFRLAGGPHLCSGRLEFLLQYLTEWGTVCDASWDLRAANVLCQQLGCGSAVAVPGQAWFGEGSGRIWAVVFECQGKETHLSQCAFSSWNRVPCSHEHDAGVICNGEEYSDVRLVNGNSPCEGRVEVFHQGQWGTVLCDASWDLRAANVLCQQLGCGSAVAVPGQAWFGKGSGPVWADVFECQGKETHLSQCAVSSWNRAPCSHEHDAGVICTGEEFCAHHCTIGEGSQSHVCIETIFCRSDPLTVKLIRSDVSAGSTLSSLNGTVRLSGESGCEGQLEVHYQHTWSRVLLDSWSIREASVVCRQLGCGSAVRIYSSSLSGTGDTDVCLTGYQCSGTESHLVNCSAPQTLSCTSSPRVSIECSSEY
uniref:SRCR domain-containing protein n=1 Tax=Scleropages formosus TaxID=113540 RepID=A0A8C9V3Q8_SCLFO